MPESNYRPDIYVDPDNEVLLIGDPAVEDHLAGMERSGFPVRILSLNEAVNGKEPMPQLSTPAPNKYKGYTRQDFIDRGRMLMGIVGNLSERKVRKLSNLDLFASVRTLCKPYYFSDFKSFTEELGQTETSPRGAYANWDIVDHAIHLRQVGLEENHQPHLGILRQRYREGKPGPSYDTIRKVSPFPDVLELAGYVQPTTRRGYEEWGYLFYLANGRLPVQRDFDPLSAKGLAPSSWSVRNSYEGGLPALKKNISYIVNNRQRVVEEEALRDLNNGIKREFTESAHDKEELVRRIGRYRIIRELVPRLPETEVVKFSRYDAAGDEFAAYVNRLDSRIEPWLVEAEARKQFLYPEVFPRGSFYRQLIVPNKWESLFAVNPSVDFKLLKKVMREKHLEGVALTSDEKRILPLIASGAHIYEVYRAVADSCTYLEVDEALHDFRQRLGASNNAHLTRICIANGLLDVQKLPGPVLNLKEREILELISYGAEMSTIGKIFNRGPANLTRYSTGALRKLGARTRAHAVALGFATGNLHASKDKSVLIKNA